MADLITSSANPAVKRMRLLADRRHRRREGAFVVQGIQPVWQAVEAGAAIEALIVAPGLLGRSPAADGLPTYQWYFKELTILNPRAARPRDCDAAIRLAAGRRLELAPLVTARFPLAEAGRALAACAEPGQLKVMLDVT